MKKQIEITDQIDFTGTGAQTVITYALPNSLSLDTDYYGVPADGTTYIDHEAKLLGFGDWAIAGVGWKKITIYTHTSTQVRFVDNTGWICHDQVHNNDMIKLTFKAHVT